MIQKLPLSESLDVHYISHTQKVDFETGELKSNRDGLPLWSVELLVTGGGLRAETCQATIAAKAFPAIPTMSAVVLEDAFASLWQQGARAGLAISAKSIRAQGSPIPKAPANGQPEPVKVG